MLFARGFHCNLHILSQRSEKLHEELQRKGARTVAHEQGDVGLLDAQDPPGLGLLQVALVSGERRHHTKIPTAPL